MTDAEDIIHRLRHIDVEDLKELDTVIEDAIQHIQDADELVDGLRNESGEFESDATRLEEEVTELQDKLYEVEGIVNVIKGARSRGLSVSLRQSLEVALVHSRETWGYHAEETKAIENILSLT
jgi:predicted Rossmann fold nucleotide-binding protein DprA/Smf involved in DNA uptake